MRLRLLICMLICLLLVWANTWFAPTLPVWADTRFVPPLPVRANIRLAPPPAAQQPTAVPTPTPTDAELIGVGQQASALSELWARYRWGILLLLGLAFAFMVFFALTKKTGEGLADFIYRVFLGRRLEERAKALEQQDEQRDDHALIVQQSLKLNARPLRSLSHWSSTW